MKAQELMLGSLVQLADDYYGVPKGTIFKVVEIYADTIFAQDIEGAYEGMELPEYKIGPIPITPEILEKNFPDTEDGVLWWKDEDGMHVETETDGDIMFCGIFHYVHQMQHALQLAGIEKDITL